MGLFDFVADMGKKLFSKDNEAPAKIKEAIEADNPGIENLTVSFADGVVKLTGRASSAEAMEKAVLIAGNVKGVTKVDTSSLQAPVQLQKVEFYTIVKGDTLSGIAKKYYGKTNEYPKIFEANREVIKNADLIYPGQKIRIPMPT